MSEYFDGDNDNDDDDGKVGYCKPPRHSRWPKGQSGNPKGRPKGSRGLKTDLEAELTSKHTAYINEEAVTDTKQRLAIKMLATRAACGDLKAAQLLVPLIIQVLGIDDRGGERRPLSALDRAILAEMLADQSDVVADEPESNSPASSDALPNPDDDDA